MTFLAISFDVRAPPAGSLDTALARLQPAPEEEIISDFPLEESMYRFKSHSYLNTLYCHFASAGSSPRSSRPGGWESLAIASPSQPIPDHGRENASRQDLIALPLPPALRQRHPSAAAPAMLPNGCSCLRLTRSSCTHRPAGCVSPCHCLAWNRSKTLHH